MATKLFLRDSNTSGAATGSDAMHDLLSAAGASVAAYVKNTLAGTVTPPTAATQFTKTGGGTVVTFASKQLNGITVSGTVTFNLWAKESATAANATITAELLRLDSAGAVVDVIGSVTLSRTECGTTIAANNWNPSVTSRTLTTGQRLGVRVYIDDGNAVTMASGRTVTMDIDGATGAADGDSWVQVAETLTYYYLGALSETLALSESVAAVMRTARAASETESLSESQAAKKGASAGLSDSESLSDSLAVQYNAKGASSDSESLSESLAARVPFTASPADDLALSEAQAAQLRRVAPLLEELVLAESLDVRLDRHVAASEALALTEAQSARLASAKLLADELALSESLSLARSSSVALSEVAALSEAAAVTRSVTASLSEGVGISESATTLAALRRDLSEAASVAEQVDVVSGSGNEQYHEHPADSLSLSDGCAARLRAMDAPLESFTLSESAVVQDADRSSLSEGLTVGETLTTRAVMASGGSMSMDLTDGMTGSHGQAAELADSSSSAAGVGGSILAHGNIHAEEVANTEVIVNEDTIYIEASDAPE